MNKRLSTLLTFLMLISTPYAAWASEIGVVDMQEVAQKYTRAQEMAKTAKTKEEELQKVQEGLAKQLKSSDKLSPVEKKNLEEKLANQFTAQLKVYRDWTIEQDQLLKADFDKAVQAVAGQMKLDVVFPKQAVIQGGKDVTQDVINVLNRQ